MGFRLLIVMDRSASSADFQTNPDRLVDIVNDIDEKIPGSTVSFLGFGRYLPESPEGITEGVPPELLLQAGNAQQLAELLTEMEFGLGFGENGAEALLEGGGYGFDGLLFIADEVSQARVSYDSNTGEFTVLSEPEAETVIEAILGWISEGKSVVMLPPRKPGFGQSQKVPFLPFKSPAGALQLTLAGSVQAQPSPHEQALFTKTGDVYAIQPVPHKSLAWYPSLDKAVEGTELPNDGPVYNASTPYIDIATEAGAWVGAISMARDPDTYRTTIVSALIGHYLLTHPE